MEDLESMGMKIGADLLLSQEDEPSFHLLREPWQNIKKIVEQRARRFRATRAGEARADFNQLKEVDNEVLDASLKRRCRREINIIK